MFLLGGLLAGERIFGVWRANGRGVVAVAADQTPDDVFGDLDHVERLLLQILDRHPMPLLSALSAAHSDRDRLLLQNTQQHSHMQRLA